MEKSGQESVAAALLMARVACATKPGAARSGCVGGRTDTVIEQLLGIIDWQHQLGIDWLGTEPAV